MAVFTVNVNMPGDMEDFKDVPIDPAQKIAPSKNTFPVASVRIRISSACTGPSRRMVWRI